MFRKHLLSFVLLFCLFGQITAQVAYTAKDIVTPYSEGFRPGSNLGYFPPWTDEDLANIAAGNPELGIKGVGVKAIRPGLFESFVEEWGYELRLPTYEHFDKLDFKDNTLIVGFPSEAHRDTTFYCDEHRSEMFANLYEPIWDNGENGTPVNENNYYALYLYKIVNLYGKYVKFWEIWNEPGFDYTGATGWLPPGQPNNWWENNPNPCDYKLRAPIFHYIRTLRISYEIIKSLDEDDYVCVSGTGYPSFLDAIMRNTDNPENGSISEDYPHRGGAYFDVMGFHSYPHFDGATRRWSPAINGFEYFRHSDAAADGIARTKGIYQDILNRYGYDGNTYPLKEWIITEINIPRKSFSDALGGEDEQVNFVMKAYLKCIKEDIRQMHIYSLAEQKAEAEANTEFDLMGLYQKVRDILPYQQKPNNAGIAYKTISDQLFGKRYDHEYTEAMNIPDNIGGAAFVDEDGYHTYVLWAKTTEDQSERAYASYSFPESFDIFELTVHEWDYSKTNNSHIIQPQFIELSARPIFLQESIFTYKPPSCAPVSVGFQALRPEGAASWQWQFEGGRPSNFFGREARVMFEEPGNHKISLTIKDINGDVLAFQTDYIRINGLPEVAFEVNAAGPILNVFNNSSENTEDFRWTFGDGTESLDVAPIHTYAANGTYEITLVAENECGIVSQTEIVEVKLPAPNRLDFTAKDIVPKYDGHFRPGSNLGFFPPWSDINLASIAAGDLTNEIEGAGVKAIRPALYGSFLDEWGYDFRTATFDAYQNLGLEDNTLIVGFPAQQERDPNHYCPTAQSEMFANLYTDIWDNGENGTPINDENHYALYLYRLVQDYGDHIKFWEIWNEPGFDYTGARGWLNENQPGNWWVDDPDPCDYKLRAPIQHFIRTLRISYEIIKTLEPDDYVTLSGTGYLSFLDAVLRNTDNPVDGSVTEDYPHRGGAYFDVMGFHSYPHFDGSTKYWDSNINGFAYKRHSDGAADGLMRVRNNMQGVLDQYGYDGDTYPNKHWTITECNIPRHNFNDFIGGDEVQRNFTIKAYVSAAINRFMQLHIYSLAEREFEEDASFEFHLMGLYNKVQGTRIYTQNKTQAGIAYKTTSDMLFGTTYDAEHTASLRLPDGVKGGAFRDVKGNYIYVLWAETRTDNTEEAAATYSFPSSFSFKELTKCEWDHSETDIEEIVSTLNIRLTGTPVFLMRSTNIINVPVAGIKAAEQIGCLPFEVQFESISTDADRHEWTFPGGIPSSSTLPNPIVTYPDTGHYAVTLKVSNDAGTHEYTIDQYIDVRDKPTAEFHAEIDGTKATFFIDSEIDDFINFFWDFGTGSTFPSPQPTYDFRNNGTYEVKLVPYSFCPGDTITQTITISAPPTATFRAIEEENCDRKVVSFINLSQNNMDNAEWYFPGGSPSISTNKNEVVIYRNSGTYEAMLIASNENGQDTITQMIEVDVSPITRITETLCESEFIVINGTTYGKDKVYGEEHIPRGAELCDSIVIVDLKISKEPITHYSELLCAGESIEVNGQIYDQSLPNGIEHIARAGLCDSIVVVNLDFITSDPSMISATVCAGKSYRLGLNYYSESGTYQDTLMSVAGCDSIITLNLSVTEPINISATEIIEDNGEGTGRAIIEVTGGEPPYEIRWNNGTEGNILENVDLGIYTVTVTDKQNCSQSMNIKIGSTAIIPSYLAYPNPVEAGRFITLEFRSPIEQDVRVIMHDMQGRVVRIEYYTATIGISTGSLLAPIVPGVYAVQMIYLETGEQFSFLQVVKPSLYTIGSN